jgi:hypothetical protein
MNSIYSHYCSGDAAVAKMLTIYIEEAHAVDEWVLPESEVEVSGEAAIPVHQSISERIAAARRLISNRRILSETVCDSMAGHVCDRYQAWPERLYIILDGIVVYKGGNGPFGYKLWEVQEWLGLKYGVRGESLRKQL